MENQEAARKSRKPGVLFSNPSSEKQPAKAETGRQLFLIHQGSLLSTMDLPAYAEGKHEFDQGVREHSFHFWIEADQGRWHIFSSGFTWLEDSSHRQFRKGILPRSGSLVIRQGAKRMDLYICPVSGKTQTVNIPLKDFQKIRIGRNPEADIQLLNPLSSRTHALIEYADRKIRVADLKSSLGTFVNGKRIASAVTKLGDVIEFPGLKVIVGAGFLSLILDPASCKLQNLKAVSLDDLYKRSRIDLSEREDPPFYRKPRTRSFHFSPQKIVVDPAPVSMNAEKIPLALRMGGPAVFSGVSALAGNYTSMISSVLFPVLTSRYTEKQRQEYEERRYRAYTAYLNQTAARIRNIQDLERRDLEDNNPAAMDLAALISRRHRLWERRMSDPDFLSLRIGIGNVALKSEISYPTRSFGVDEDPLMAQMYSLVTQDYSLDDAPVSIDFYENFISGFRGSPQEREKLFLSILFELCYLHSPEEVRVVVLAEEDQLKHFEWIRYLPHVWNEEKDFRFIATTPAECAQISTRLSERVEEALKHHPDRKTVMKTAPYYMVFSFSLPLLNAVSAFEKVLNSESSIGFSIVSLSDSLPSSTLILGDLNPSESRMLQLRHQENPDFSFVPDRISPDVLEAAGSKISNLLLPVSEKKDQLPGMITFLEMYQAGRIEHLSILKRWKESNPMKSLAVPVGVYPDGSLFYLDLHEKAHGPHGLIAGMTGSGKSEFIITYILSMAVNYHPDEVSFILIDFKGGGLTGAFEDESRGIRLPHLAGTITNLDENTMARALASIESELKRRQLIFNEAKSAVNEGTMDIYGYQQLYRNGLVSEPVSHLFIISDEFAELKSQQPEFMDQLISAARIGRSLGVHLILATQKPAGVVNEQIWSNSKFKVCLKVQDRIDSMDMLKRPEAAEIRETGRFYLQVGYNEYFALGQSAWAGASYEPADEVVTKPDDEILFVDPIGQPIFKTRPQIKKKEKDRTQLVEIMSQLTASARDNRIQARALWLDPLKKQIDLDALPVSEKRWEAVIGFYDDPSRQMQKPLTLDLLKAGNIFICGEPGTGKSSLIQTILLSAARTHSPDQLQFYILDLPGKTFAGFEDLKHTGCCMLRPDAEERKRMLLKLQEILDSRKNQFMALRLNRFEDVHQENGLPLILIVMDGFDSLPDDREGREFQESIAALAREGRAYGIQMILSAVSNRNLYSRLRSEISFNLPLRLKESFQYYDLFGERAGVNPENCPGRGLIRLEKRILEFQSARLAAFETESRRNSLIMKRIRDLNEKYMTSGHPERVVVLDRKQTYDDFLETCHPGRIPLGILKETVKPVSLPLQQMFTLALYFGHPEVSKLVWPHIRKAVRFNHGRILYTGSAENVQPEDEFYSRSEKDTNRLMDVLQDLVRERTGIRKRICQDLKIEDWKNEASKKKWRKEMRKKTEPLFLLIESLADFCLLLSDTEAGFMQTLLEMADGYNLYLIAGFSPDDRRKLEAASESFEASESRSMSPDDIFVRLSRLVSGCEGLLFGGRFTGQNLFRLPLEYSRIESAFEYKALNQAILVSRGQTGKLLFPMGDLEVNSAEDEDELPLL